MFYDHPCVFNALTVPPMDPSLWSVTLSNNAFILISMTPFKLSSLMIWASCKYHELLNYSCKNVRGYSSKVDITFKALLLWHVAVCVIFVMFNRSLCTPTPLISTIRQIFGLFLKLCTQLSAFVCVCCVFHQFVCCGVDHIGLSSRYTTRPYAAANCDG